MLESLEPRRLLGFDTLTGVANVTGGGTSTFSTSGFESVS